ncbi:MAG: TssA family type VI secretion system protein [Colwellia sp.]|nr:TssA family type VI secretion system protein [Colwellia sp.]
MKEHYTHSDWNTWLENLCCPFTELTCGEDLKYEEDFKYLKSSFSGVSELDCKKIFVIGTQLSANKSKDLRIASYLLFGAASEYGVEGLVNGLALFNRFVALFLSDIHPIKDKGRKAVHTWLLSQQNRMVALAEQQGIFDPEQIVNLHEQLAIYANETIRKIDDNAGPLSELKQWADKLASKYPVIIPDVALEKVAQQITQSSTMAEATNSDHQVNENQINERVTASAPSNVQIAPLPQIDSDTQFAETLRKLLSFDKENQNLTRLVALSRAARWSDIKLPPNEQGKTRIPAPRNTAFTPIVNALANDDYLTAFMLGEALFMEGAMHFNLDLQIMQLTALKGLGNTVVTNQLEFSLYQLSSRFPQLTQLTYDDSSALCSAKTKDVIADIAAQFTQVSTSVSGIDEAFEQTEVLAKAQVELGKLDSALTIVNTLSTCNAYGRAQLLLMKAKMCLLAERYDFAAPMLTELIDTIEKHQLGQWQPTLSMQIWRSAILCFDTLAAKGNEKLAEQSHILKQKMILTQPEVALGWI